MIRFRISPSSDRIEDTKKIFRNQSSLGVHWVMTHREKKVADSIQDCISFAWQ